MNINEFKLDIPIGSYSNSHFISILRPWINVGNVGHNVISRLVDIFELEEIGELSRPSKYYDMTRYRPEILYENGERIIRIPNTKIFGKKNPQGNNEINMFLIYMLEPHNNSEDYNDAMIDLIQKLDGKRFVSVGGMFDSVPHTRPLPVTGTYKGWIPPKPLDEILKFNSKYEGPTSITNQLGNLLNNAISIELLSLMVHIPLYIKLNDDYMATSRLLEFLSRIYDFPTNFPEKQKGINQYQKLNKDLSNNNSILDIIKKFENEQNISKQDLDLSPEIEDFLKGLEEN